MRRLVKKRELISMDLTPLIDVVFLLLIFFIVASEFKKNETILNLSLPASQSSSQIVKKEEVVIEITKEKLAYNSKETDFLQLEESLKDIDKKRALIVRIDKEVKYERVVKLLDLLNKLSLSNLLLVTKEDKK
ncbi:ExbD/TolR family protein [Arcobacter roscoffensis]|uniref:Biopolymer transporter ExbD n=1 Tax=Arcobacter roscoffensis TaxID=2961520 RepID=A0ABY5E484_9BACT|nr:biopolymer transporter ExbD [Arcobacter roscoffensis]UTJ06555.1 biopolymer transporter ExbD [Arcobacter roscoffensis]